MMLQKCVSFIMATSLTASRSRRQWRTAGVDRALDGIELRLANEAGSSDFDGTDGRHISMSPDGNLGKRGYFEFFLEILQSPVRGGA